MREVRKSLGKRERANSVLTPLFLQLVWCRPAKVWHVERRQQQQQQQQQWRQEEEGRRMRRRRRCDENVLCRVLFLDQLRRAPLLHFFASSKATLRFRLRVPGTVLFDGVCGRRAREGEKRVSCWGGGERQRRKEEEEEEEEEEVGCLFSSFLKASPG